jgi:glycosyltransferase involved in cell wall biosynthesis
MSPPVVAFVTAYNPAESVRGGIESHVASLAEGFVGAGNRTYVLTMGKVRSPTTATVGDVNYLVLPDGGFSNSFVRNLRFGLIGKRAVEEAERRFRVDFFIGEAGHALPLVLAKLRRSTQVLTVHSGEAHSRLVARLDLQTGKFWAGTLKLLATPLLRAWRSLYLDRANGIVYVSRFTQADIESIYPRLTHKPRTVIPNGVDAPPGSGSRPPPKYDLAFVGRLESVKGADIFLGALTELSRHGIRPKIAVAGDGSFSRAFADAGADPEIGSNWSLLGRVPHSEALRIISQSKFLVAPSLIESDPLVVKEGLAFGVPVICFNVASIEALYTEAEVIFSGSPSAEHLAQTIEKVLSWPESEYARHTGEMRERSLLQSWLKVSEEYLRFLESLRSTPSTTNDQ